MKLFPGKTTHNCLFRISSHFQSHNGDHHHSVTTLCVHKNKKKPNVRHNRLFCLFSKKEKEKTVFSKVWPRGFWPFWEEKTVFSSLFLFFFLVISLSFFLLLSSFMNLNHLTIAFFGKNHYHSFTSFPSFLNIQSDSPICPVLPLITIFND